MKKLTIERDSLFEYGSSKSNNKEMILLKDFLDKGGLFMDLMEEEIRSDLNQGDTRTFTFIETELQPHDHYFYLRYNDAFFWSFDEEYPVPPEYIFAPQEEFFRLSKIYASISKENNWKEITVTFDGKLFDISSKNFPEEVLIYQRMIKDGIEPENFIHSAEFNEAFKKAIEVSKKFDDCYEFFYNNISIDERELYRNLHGDLSGEDIRHRPHFYMPCCFNVKSEQVSPHGEKLGIPEIRNEKLKKEHKKSKRQQNIHVTTFGPFWDLEKVLSAIQDGIKDERFNCLETEGGYKKYKIFDVCACGMEIEFIVSDKGKIQIICPSANWLERNLGAKCTKS